MQKVLIVLVLLLLIPLRPVEAQETETPTPTATATATVTLTPTLTLTPWALSLTEFAQDSTDTAASVIVLIPIIMGVALAVFIATLIVSQIRGIVE